VSIRLRPIGRILALVEPLALLLVAPLLLFPSLRPRWTAAGLAVLVGFMVARWVISGVLWPATPFNAALLVFGLMLPVAWWASTWHDLSWPKLMRIVLGLATFRVLVLSVYSRRTLVWGLVVFFAVGTCILALGALSTDWPFKVVLLWPLVLRLPSHLIMLPGTDDWTINVNQLAGATLLYLPLLIALAPGWWRARRRWMALLALAGAGVVTALLLLTQSRSGWIGSAAGGLALVVLAGLTSRRPAWLYASIVLLVLFLVVLGGASIALVPQRLDVLWPSDTGLSALSSRAEIWSRALSAIHDLPFTGSGLGAFRRVVYLLYPLFSIGPEVDIAHAHNMFLQVALDVGLPGLIAYLALVWLAGVVAWQAVRQGPSPLVRAVALGLISGMIGLHIYGITDALPLGSELSIAFWLVLGLLATLPQVAADELCLPGLSVLGYP
jgi:putative inorganic carbon (HCO3(-)) transporter